jgi:thiol-disulfide isomerase/thioredoxin
MENSLREIYNSLIIIFKSILNDKQLLIIIIISLIIFISLSYYLFITFIKPNISFSYVTNKEYINNDLNKNNNDDVLIMLFKTEWCPHCKKALPEWYKFVDYIDELNETIDYTIRSSIIDCDKQEDIANKYNIESYPSIILLYKNKTYYYDASADKDNLITFLESSINKNNPVIYSKN